MNHKIKFKKINYLWYILFFLSYSLFAQFNIPKSPKKIYPVNDYAKVLTIKQKKYLNQKLINYNKYTSTEIVLISIKNLNGEDPNFIAANWGEKWKIGKKKRDNGILILLSIEDKKIAIQNGRGIEPYLTDAVSKRIIENKLIPLLKKKKYYKAFDKAIDNIFKVVKNVYKNNKSISKKYEWKNFIFFILIFLLFLFLFQINNSKKSSIIRDLITGILFLSINRKNNEDFEENDENFDGFGEGGSFGGGGSSGKW